MLPRQIRPIRQLKSVPMAWQYGFQSPPAPEAPVPFSHQDILRRRAEQVAREYMKSQPQTLTDPGINERYASSIRDEYGLADDRGLRTAAQIIGGTAGAALSAKGAIAAFHTIKGGALLGSAFGPVGTGIGAVTGAIVAGALMIGGTHLGASIGGMLTPSGAVGTYDMLRDILVNTTKNPTSGAITLGSMTAGAVIGAKLGGTAGAKVARLGGALGAAVGGTAGGMAGNEIDKALSKNHDPMAGLSPVMAMGNTIDQYSGANVFKSAVYSLQGEDTLIENLKKTYGIHEEGFSRIDFSDIRKKTGLDIGAFGNGVVDYLGEVVMDPVNWAQGMQTRIARKATNTGLTYTASIAGTKFPEGHINSKIINALDAKDINLATSLYKKATSAARQEILPVVLARTMQTGTIKSISKTVLDSSINESKAFDTFKNIILQDDSARLFLTDLTKGPEQLNSNIKRLWNSYKVNINRVLTDTDINIMKKIEANKTQTETNIKEMQKLNPNFDSFDYLPQHLKKYYRTKGFTFTPYHTSKVIEQYPGIKHYTDSLDLINRWGMRILNPLYLAGTEGVKSIWNIVKHSDRGIKYVVKNLSKFNQGRNTFIDIDTKDGFLKVKASDNVKNFVVKVVEAQNRLKQEEQEAWEKISAFKEIDNQMREHIETKKQQIDLELKHKRDAIRSEIDAYFEDMKVYYGDTLIDEVTVKIAQKDLKDIIKKLSAGPLDNKVRMDLQLKKIKLEDLIKQWDILKAYQDMNSEVLKVYTEIKKLLDHIDITYEKFEILHKNVTSQLKTKPTGKDAYIDKRAAWTEYLERMNELVKHKEGVLVNTIKAVRGTEDQLQIYSSKEFQSLLKVIKNHKAMRHLPNFQKEVNKAKTKSYTEDMTNYANDKIELHNNDQPYFYKSKEYNLISEENSLNILNDIVAEKYNNFKNEFKYVGINIDVIKESLSSEVNDFVSSDGKETLYNLTLDNVVLSLADKYDMPMNDILYYAEEYMRGNEIEIPETLSSNKRAEYENNKIKKGNPIKKIIGLDEKYNINEVKKERTNTVKRSQQLEKDYLFKLNRFLKEKEMNVLEGFTMQHSSLGEVTLVKTSTNHIKVVDASGKTKLLHIRTITDGTLNFDTPMSIQNAKAKYLNMRNKVNDLDNIVKDYNQEYNSKKKNPKLLKNKGAMNTLDRMVKKYYTRVDGVRRIDTLEKSKADVIRDYVEGNLKRILLDVTEHYMGTSEENIDTFFTKLLNYKNYSKKNINRESTDSMYPGSTEDTTGYYDMSEPIKVLETIYGVDIDTMLTRRSKFISRLNEQPIKIDGKKIDITDKPNSLFPYIEKLAEQLDSTIDNPIFKAEYKRILKTQSGKDFAIARDMRILFKQMTKQFFIFQVGQNINKVQQYVDVKNLDDIENLYQAFTSDGENLTGIYKFLNDFITEHSTEEYSEINDIRVKSLRLRNSSKLITDIVNNPILKDGLVKPYPNNEVLGPLFDSIDYINRYFNFITSDGEIVNKSQLKYKYDSIEEYINKLEAPQELKDLLLYDVYDKILNEDNPESILNKGVHSVYNTGVYFEELNRDNSSKIADFLKEIWDVQYEDIRTKEEQERSKLVGGQTSGKSEVYKEDAKALQGLEKEIFDLSIEYNKLLQQEIKKEVSKYKKFDKNIESIDDIPEKHHKLIYDAVLENPKIQELRKQIGPKLNTTMELKKKAYQELQEQYLYPGDVVDFERYYDISKKELSDTIELFLTEEIHKQIGYTDLDILPASKKIQHTVRLLKNIYGDNFSFEKLEALLTTLKGNNKEKLNEVARFIVDNSNIEASKNLDEFIRVKKELTDLDTIVNKIINEKFHRDMIKENEASAEINDDMLPEFTKQHLLETRNNIKDWKARTQTPLKEVKNINDNLRTNLFTASYEQKLNHPKPFNTSQLVKKGSPFVWRRAVTANFLSSQKKTIRTLFDNKSDLFQYDYSIRDLQEIIGGEFDSFEKVLDAYRTDPHKYNKKIMKDIGLDVGEKLSDLVLTVFDTETKSLHRKPGRTDLIQLAATSEDMTDFNKLVAGQIIPEAIEDLTGITQDDLIKNGFPLQEVIDAFANYINKEAPKGKKRALVGHNIEFDMARLKNETGIDFEKYPILDTLSLISKIYGNEKFRRNLENVYEFIYEKQKTKTMQEQNLTEEQFNEKYSKKDLSFHNALDDVAATLYIMKHLKAEMESQGIETTNEILVNYDYQKNERASILGDHINSSMSAFDLFYGLDPEGKQILKDILVSKGEDPNQSISDIKSKYTKNYNVSDLNKFDIPSLMDLDAWHNAYELIHTKDIIRQEKVGSDEYYQEANKEVMEFYRLTDRFKNKVGFDSPQGRYMLILYKSKYNYMDGSIDAYVDKMKQYSSDISTDQIKKAYAYYMSNRYGVSDQLLYSETGTLKDEMKNEIKDLVLEVNKNIHDYSKAVTQHQKQHDKIQELRQKLGGYKLKPDSTSFRDTAKILHTVTEENGVELVRYLNTYFEDKPFIDTNKLAKDIEAYRKINPDKIDWNHPLINKMLGYMGEEGKFTIKTNEQARMDYLYKSIEDMLDQRNQSSDIQVKVKKLRNHLKKLSRQEVFQNKDTKKEQENIINELRKHYDPETIRELQNMLSEYNQLRVDTFSQKDIDHSEVEWQDGIPKESDDYTITFKMEWEEGKSEEIQNLNRKRKLIENISKEHNRRYEKLLEQKIENLKKKYGHFNDSKTKLRAESLNELLLKGDYDNFTKEYRKYIPDAKAERIEEIIKQFEKDVVRKQQGKNVYHLFPEITKEKQTEKVRLSKDQEINRDVYVKNIKRKTSLIDQDDIFYYMTGKERYQNWMRSESKLVELQILLDLYTYEKTNGTYVEPTWQEGTKQTEAKFDILKTPEDEGISDIEQQQDIVKQREEELMAEDAKVKRVLQLGSFFKMNLGDIKQVFKNGAELQKFLEQNPHYRLVGIVGDDTPAAKDPSRFFGGEENTQLKKKYSKYREQQALSNKEKIELEEYRKGRYEKDKPTSKEILWRDANDLDKLFDYNSDELHIGLMSTDSYKSAKQISYKPFKLPPALDWMYRNVIRLQKSEMLVSSRWHVTNIVDVMRKNSTMVENIWDTKQYMQAFKDASDLNSLWHGYKQDSVRRVIELENSLDSAIIPEERKEIIQEIYELGSIGFDEYIKKRGYANEITTDVFNKTPDSELDLGTHLYLKHKNKKSFKQLDEQGKLDYLNERLEDLLYELKDVDEFQTSSATTDLPTFIQKMDEHQLGQSKTIDRKVFRYLATENPVMKMNMKTATSIEQVARLHGYLLDKYLFGTSHDAAVHRSLKRHFDYSDRSSVEMYATLMFPFTAFPIRNALFWQEMLMNATLNRRLFHLMIAAWGEYDTDNNEYAQTMQRRGYIPLGNTLFKIGDSRMSALATGNAFSDTARSRLNPLLKAPMEIIQGDKTTGEALRDATPILRRIPGMVKQLQAGMQSDNDDLLRRSVATGIGAGLGTIIKPGIGTAIGGAYGAIGGGNQFPGIFGTIYNDQDYQRPVFRWRRNIYNQLYNQQGKVRELSNNAYYRTKQIMYDTQRRRNM